MKRITVLSLAIFMFFQVLSQNIDLTFTAVVDQSYIMLDSIKIMNRSKGCDTLLIFPDTTLILPLVGIYLNEMRNQTLSISQNHPNPFTDHTLFSVFLPDKEYLHLIVHNLQGQKIAEYHSMIDAGTNQFTFYPTNDNWYVVTATTPNGSQSIKMSCLASGSIQGKIVRTDEIDFSGTEKATPLDDYFKYEIGDQLLFIGYVNSFAGVLESGILDSPDESKSYTFQFATNIPCPGTPTVDYEGQIYHTIQIFSQCWLKQNLNVGIMISGTQEMTNNNTIEKYCYNNVLDSCKLYGGLYRWDEMMDYSLIPGVQGICPSGWHLPTNEEWNLLEGAVDTYYCIGALIWDTIGFRGSDAGLILKKTNGWWFDNGNGTDLFGFSAQPGGIINPTNDFFSIGSQGYWWTSNEGDNSTGWCRFLRYYHPASWRMNYAKNDGFSVRCIKD